MGELLKKISESPDILQARNHFQYPTRWNPLLADFVGWTRSNPRSDLTEPVWRNKKNQIKYLSFDNTYAQLMFGLEKVEEHLGCRSIVGTESCFLFPFGKNSKLKQPIEFKNAKRQQCVFNCIVEAILISQNKSKNEKENQNG